MDIIKKLFSFYSSFTGDKGFLGFTTLGYPIPYFCISKGTYPVVFAQGGIHGREYITTSVLIKAVKYLQSLPFNGTLYIAPAINIDGIKLALLDKDFKANANGVDLNTNFPARWGTGSQNKTKLSKSDYIGKSVASEIEVKSLMSFTKYINPDATVSFHSKGEEIYFDFFNPFLQNLHYPLARAISDVTGYAIKVNLPSAGGYKDWCLQFLSIPSFTIEVGSDSLSHPIDLSYTDEIFLKVKDVLPTLIKEL